MTVSTEVVARKFLDVAVDNPVYVDFPMYSEDEVQVYIGSTLAVLNTDYTVQLELDFDTFAIVPLQPMLDKLEGVENVIVVRSNIPATTDSTANLARNTTFTSREHDRGARRDAQMSEALARAILVGPQFIGDELRVVINDVEEGKTLVFENGAISAGPDASEIAAAQGYAEAAANYLAQFTTATGFVDLVAVGGVADAVVDVNGVATSGTNNDAAFASAAAMAASLGLDLRVPNGRFLLSGDTVLPEGVNLRGQGYDAILHFQGGSSETGLLNPGDGFVSDITLHFEATGDKTANSGHYHCCMTVTSNGFIETTAHTEIINWACNNIRCTRAATGFTSNGHGIYVVGNVTRGHIGMVDDIGTPKDHSGVVAAHWGAHNTNGGFGFEHDETYPVLGHVIGTIIATASGDALTTSAVGDFYVDQIVLAGPNVERAWYQLPGDEGTTGMRVEAAHRVGKNLHVRSISIIECGNDDGELLDMNGAGTSRWEVYPNDPTVLRKAQVPLEIRIDSISVNFQPSSGSKRLVYLNQMRGSVSIGRIYAPGWDIGSLIDVNLCRGEFSCVIDNIVGIGKITIDRSTGVTIRSGHIKIADVTSVDTSAMYLFGQEPTTTLDGAVAKDADEITLDSSFSIDLSVGDILDFGTCTAEVTEFFEQTATPSCLVISVTAMPVAVADGTTVTLKSRSRVKVDDLKCEGGYYAVDIAASDLTASNLTVKGAGYRGLRARDGSTMRDTLTTYEANGVNRKDNGSLSTRDIVVNEDCIVRSVSPYFGLNGYLTEYNIHVPDSDADDDNRIIVFGGLFDQSITGEVLASSATDYDLVNCTKVSDGSAVT